MLNFKTLSILSGTISALLALCPLSPRATAQIAGTQTAPAVGMHHLTPKPAPATAPTQPAAPQLEEAAKIPEKPPEYTPLSAKEALVKPEDIRDWNHTDEILSAHSQKELEKLSYLIESDRGAVPPAALFLAAKSFADQRDMEKAALYFFVGQLRLTFDVARWPPRANPDDIKRLNTESLKTADQKQNETGSGPRIENPHASVINLANSLSHPILVWAMKEPGRLDKILDKVKEWDASAPYAYDPGYETGTAAPFETWPKILTEVRENYFKQMRGLSHALSKVQ